MNINGPDDSKINIQEFDLNIEYRLMFREKCKTERQEYESKMLDDIKKFKIETQNTLKEHWDSLFVKPKSIYVWCIIVRDNVSTRYVLQMLLHTML